MGFDLSAFAGELADQLKIGNAQQAASTLIKNVDILKNKNGPVKSSVPNISAKVEATPYTEAAQAGAGILSRQNLFIIGGVFIAIVVIAKLAKGK